MDHPLPLLKRHLKVNQADMINVLTAAKRRVEGFIRKRALDPRFATSGAFRDDTYKGISGHYAELEKSLSKWGDSVVKNTSKDFFGKAASDIPVGKKAGLMKFSKKYAKGYIELIHPKNGPALAAVRTQKMLQSDILQLRNAVVETFREGALTGMSSLERKKALQARVTKLASGGVDSWKFISGDGKNWKSGNYFMTLNRTITAKVAKETYVDSMLEAGHDLATIEGGGDPCPICEAWRGVVVSVSGSNPDYPSLADAEAAGVFHPNCVCQIAYIDKVIGKDVLDKQAKTPNPEKPDPEEWTKYARETKKDAPEKPVSVAKKTDALKVDKTLDKELKAQQEPKKQITTTEWAKSLNDEEKKVVLYYQGSGHEKIRMIETTGKGQKHIKDATRTLSKALDKAPVYDGTVYRGLSDMNKTDYNKLVKMKTLTLDATSSASKDLKAAEYFASGFNPKSKRILYEIKNNKTGVDITGLVGNEEKEVTLRKGAKYKVLGREEVKVGKNNYSAMKLTIEEIED